MSYNAHFYEKDGQLWFHLDKPATTQPAIPFEFDGPATDRHKKEYDRQFMAFEASKATKESIVDEMFEAQANPIFDDEA